MKHDIMDLESNLMQRAEIIIRGISMDKDFKMDLGEV